MTVFIACAFAVPLNPAGCELRFCRDTLFLLISPAALGRRDRDEDVVYPDEKFYAEEYKRCTIVAR